MGRENIMSQNKAPKNHVFYRNQNWHYPKITHGKGIFLYDDTGKDYIDGCSGSAVANLGHGNEEIAEVARQQIETVAFTHLSRFTADPIEKACEKIASWAPEGLNHVYLVSGGSEAVETAIKMARQYYVERDGDKTGKSKVISKWNSYHGSTLGALALTGIPGRRRIYASMLMDFPKINQFYHYRNPYNARTLYETSVFAARELEHTIQMEGAENIAAFLTEPVVGSAAPGVHPDKVYFEMVREICDRYDILLIVDEVMAGFGRTGRRLASDHFDLRADIVVAAKGMSAGYTPMGAAIASDEIFDTIMVRGSGKFIHGHTYASNPLSAAISARVIEIMERDRIIEEGQAVSEHYVKGLEAFNDYSFVGDIRGLGFMHGIEFVKNKETKEPFGKGANFAGRLTNACLDAGLVVYPGTGSVDGVLGDHILLAPPINITLAETDQMLGRMHAGFQTMEKMLKEDK